MSTALAFRFPAGRYHATPWDRSVNEADVEWPPSPWRILRALLATWHRKGHPDRHPREDLAGLLRSLAGVRPAYSLPPVTHSHVRHYMPERDGRREKRTLIFDAFVAVDPADDLVVCWEDVELEPPQRRLLSELLHVMAYLGRAESWTEARLLEDPWSGGFNCLPEGPGGVPPSADLDVPVRLPIALAASDYEEWRSGMVEELGLNAGRLRKKERKILVTLPETVVEAMEVETADIRAAGWAHAPAASFVTYYRRDLRAALRRPPRREGGDRARQITTVRLALAGKPLPRFEDAVRVGELVRKGAMRKAGDLKADRALRMLSGHDMPDENVHEHAFYLPEANEKGRVDHVLIHAAGGLGRVALGALENLRKVWEPGGGTWAVVLEAFGDEETFSSHPYLAPSTTWRSATPYLHPWFRKKGFDVEDQILKECRLRGLPEPSIDRFESIEIRGRARRPVHFRRVRSRRGLVQPDTRGGFFELNFPEPIFGPLALGFGCHFGLGLFRSAGSA